jgi:hypothetical protein
MFRIPVLGLEVIGGASKKGQESWHQILKYDDADWEEIVLKLFKLLRLNDMN